MTKATSIKYEANEMLRRAATDSGPIPFYCECGDIGCLAPVWLTPADYDRRRVDAGGRLLCEHLPEAAVRRAS